VTRCSACSNEAVLTPYFNDDVHLCHACAQELAQRLDDEDLWPPVGGVEEVLTTLIPEIPLHHDGEALERLAKTMHNVGVRLHVEFVDGHPVMSFTEPMPIPMLAARMAGAHHGLLVSAWLEQHNRVIKLCSHCRSPFVLAPSNKSKCPVCAKGSRTITLNMPFTARPIKRKAS
jgi:hypothetical protein